MWRDFAAARLPRLSRNMLRVIVLIAAALVIGAVLAARPSRDPEAMMRQVRELSLNFEYEEALRVAEDALTIVKNGVYPDEYLAKFYLLRGQMWLNVYEWDYALGDFNAAITLAPEYPEAYYLRGLFYASVADINSAIADFEQVIALAPSGPFASNANAALTNLTHQRDALGGG